jgi:hypothetical protein
MSIIIPSINHKYENIQKKKKKKKKKKKGTSKVHSDLACPREIYPDPVPFTLTIVHIV